MNNPGPGLKPGSPRGAEMRWKWGEKTPRSRVQFPGVTARKNPKLEGDGEEAQPRKVVTMRSSRPREGKTTERQGSRRNDQEVKTS